MVKALMPQATAVWLIDHTALSFDQISDFCGLHLLEVQAIADGDTAKSIRGVNPIDGNQVTKEEIERCEKDPAARLQFSEKGVRYAAIHDKHKAKGKYVPVAKRGDKPDAVFWVLKNRPEISDAQIVKLLGTTKAMIESIRNKTHWNYKILKPRDPVMLDICTQGELDDAYEIAKVKAEQEAKEAEEKKIQETNA